MASPTQTPQRDQRKQRRNWSLPVGTYTATLRPTPGLATRLQPLCLALSPFYASRQKWKYSESQKWGAGSLWGKHGYWLSNHELKAFFSLPIVHAKMYYECNRGGSRKSSVLQVVSRGKHAGEICYSLKRCLCGNWWMSNSHINIHFNSLKIPFFSGRWLGYEKSTQQITSKHWTNCSHLKWTEMNEDYRENGKINIHNSIISESRG